MQSFVRLCRRKVSFTGTRYPGTIPGLLRVQVKPEIPISSVKETLEHELWLGSAAIKGYEPRGADQREG